MVVSLARIAGQFLLGSTCVFSLAFRRVRHGLHELRRTHEIESVAASFDDYLLLEAAYDVDFDE